MLMRIGSVLSASLIQVILLAVSSFALAKVMTVEDFAATRTLGAWLMIFSIVGHFCLHDAATTLIAKTADRSERRRLLNSAICWVLIISCVLTLVVAISSINYGQYLGTAGSELYKVIWCLPFLCLSILWNALMQIFSSVKALNLYVILMGAVPSAVLLLGAFFEGLPGWIGGRVLSAVSLAAVGFFLLRIGMPKLESHPIERSKLFSFARIQIGSGLLSIALQSIDILLLAQLSKVEEVANYGLAVLMTRSLGFIPNSLSRLYYARIAEGRVGGALPAAILSYLKVSLLLSVLCATALYFMSAPLLAYFYEDKYLGIGSLLDFLCLGLPGYFLWTTLGIIFTAQGKPKASLITSLCVFIFSLIGLCVFVPEQGAIACAKVMMLSYYVAAVIAFVFLLFGNKNYFPRSSVKPTN